MPNIICLTGDIGWKGAASDYEAAKVWLKSLLKVLKLTPKDLFVCPGNHDIARKIAARNARPTTADDADLCLQPPVAEIATAPAFAAYTAICKEFGIRPFTIGSGAGSEKSFLVGVVEHKGIRFIGWNTAWYCQGDDDKNKLWIGLPILRVLEAQNELTPNNTTPTVCLLHHPPDWWHEAEIHAGKGRPNTLDQLALRCHVILSGHTHGEPRKADRIANSAYHLTGGSAFAEASHFNSFRLVRIEEGQMEYRTFQFDPISPESVWHDRWGTLKDSFGEGKRDKRSPPPSESLAEAIAKYKRDVDLAWRGGQDENGNDLLGAVGKPLGQWIEMETHQDFKDASARPK